MCIRDRLHGESHAAYQLLLDQSILTLPSTNTLRKITRKVNSQTGLSNTEYLRLRQSKLDQIQRHCILIIDEIYVSKRPEYAGGKIYGVTGNSEIATTLLCQ